MTSVFYCRFKAVLASVIMYGGDLALKNLIQPLAGEYGMHNGQEQGSSCHHEIANSSLVEIYKLFWPPSLVLEC